MWKSNEIEIALVHFVNHRWRHHRQHPLLLGWKRLEPPVQISDKRSIPPGLPHQSTCQKVSNEMRRCFLKNSSWIQFDLDFRLMEEGGVVFYCDLHAHSRKFNVFIYGCENRRHSEKYLKEQVFPLMLHKNTAEKFSFEDCRFHIQVRTHWAQSVVFTWH